MNARVQQEMIDYELVNHNSLREMYNKRADDLSYEAWFVGRYTLVNNTFLTEDEFSFLIDLKGYITRNYLELTTAHHARLNLGDNIKLLPFFIQHFNNFKNQ